MSLPLGIATLVVIAGAWLARWAWDELGWRRDQRRAARLLDRISRREWGVFYETHDEICDLPVWLDVTR